MRSTILLTLSNLALKKDLSAILISQLYQFRPAIMRTRSSAPQASDANQSGKKLASSDKPKKTFILPTDTSAGARFMTLPNPQDGSPTRYLFCPERGLYEFTIVASHPQVPRSILFAPSANDKIDGCAVGKGNLSKIAQLLVATPIDVVFFLVPILSLASTSGQAKGLFQPLDDIIDSQDDIPQNLRYVLYNKTFRRVLENRAQAVCDVVEAGDEKMFRYSEQKLLTELLAKAERMVTNGLPGSLEERFVRQALATPLMSVKREDTTVSSEPLNDTQGEASSIDQSDTQSTVTATTSDTASTSASTPMTQSTPPTPLVPETLSSPLEMAYLSRVSTALSFMKESYLSPALSSRIDALLASPDSPIDFKPLTAHLKLLAELRAEAHASRAATDFTRKRGLDDEEAAELRAEKKRKKEEEEKRKKTGESRGVRDLKKVNTAGMKKMSDFFSRTTATKKT